MTYISEGPCGIIEDNAGFVWLLAHPLGKEMLHILMLCVQLFKFLLELGQRDQAIQIPGQVLERVEGGIHKLIDLANNLFYKIKDAKIHHHEVVGAWVGVLWLEQNVNK